MSSRQFPASFPQKRLWFLDEFDRGNPAYNLPRVFHIQGRLRVDILRDALQQVVNRHETLRTVFAEADGQPRQVVLSELAVPIPVLDLSRLSNLHAQEEIRRITAEESQRSFDLAEGPLIRAKVAQLSDSESFLFLSTHHIVTDGWSMGVLFEEITKTYAALANGESAADLPELTIHYSDYVAWQNELLSEAFVGGEIEYWRTKLAGAPATLDLPTDHRRPARHTWNGGSVRVPCGKELAAQLQSVAQSFGASLFMVLLAAFQSLLWRYTSQQSLLIGTPVAGRNDVETEKLIGLFVNTLVLRADFEEDMTFSQFLIQARENSFEAQAHQELPFEKLVEKLAPNRALDSTPLFQAMFVLQNLPKQSFEIPGLLIEEVEFETGVSKFDLTLEIEPEDGLKCRFEYNTNLFERSTIERMSGHYTNILHRIAADPNLKISSIPLLTEAERTQIVVDWNRTGHDYPLDLPLNEFVEAQADQTPEAPAVVFGGEQLSYAEFNARANRLARWLRSRGVGPDVLVGVCAERSIEMVVALHAIVKAGGAYVPMDPTNPRDRLAVILEDARPAVVLTQQYLADRIPAGYEVFCLDAVS